MRAFPTTFILCLSPILCGLVACSDQISRTALPLGAVEIIQDESCSDGRCVQFVVQHDALDQDASGELIITEPDGAIEGTIVVFSGGGGTRIWGAVNPDAPAFDVPARRDTIDSWIEAGFRVARIKWDRNWFEGASVDEGFVRLAAKPATITDWISENVSVETGPICVGGGSGGAGQTSYMLTHYGLEDRISLAVPWSGFWMGRIDTGCVDSDPLNSLLHFNDRARRAIDLSYGFSDGETGPCQRRDDSFEDEFFRASIAGSGDFFYPNTLVHHILGGADEVGEGAAPR